MGAQASDRRSDSKDHARNVGEVPPNESMTPILPCTDVEATVAFYSQFGFTLVHRQDKPYVYLAFTWRGVSLHFGRPPAGADLEREDFACLVAVDDVSPYHNHLAATLKKRLGRVPSSGRPRITRLRPGASRFTLVDPNGNNIIFVRRDEPKSLEYGGSPQLTGVAKALDNARILRDYRNDAHAAFRALDSALRRPKPGDRRVDQATALIWMIELAPDSGAEDRIPELAATIPYLEPTELAAALATATDPHHVRRLLDGVKSGPNA
ncbi:glyoxalase [Saccharomonospora xinjiangensis]|uniref:glyoxalase n=1 Tax=Saccharomonospora xinjiangensis TaxID=75294 RepID=UPI00350F2455